MVIRRDAYIDVQSVPKSTARVTARKSEVCEAFSVCRCE
jgi:hypothetical protein